ncbi:lipoxygenase [Xylaria curta]|nr:lipoxygenase [Xylaria curta]
MVKFFPGILYAGVAVDAAAIQGSMWSRGGSHVNRAAVNPYSLPSLDVDVSTRAEALRVKREGWQYGPSIAGNTSFYPIGTLADVTTKADTDALFTFQNKHAANVNIDKQTAFDAINATGGVKSLGEYRKLYDHQWVLTAPEGPYTGMLSNYTSDLLFSMERLSTAPASVARVGANDALLFAVDNAASIAGLSLEQLQAQGRLFVIDYLDQKDLPRSSEYKFGAACQAYFYIHPQSGDFLPLAIKPNVEGSDLVYTPEDEENDWTLAKLMFNLNDVWFTQWFHLAAGHEAAEIVYLAAIRTLSEEHPLMSILHRLMKQCWAMRHSAEERLINVGGPVDQLFPWAGSSAGKYTDALYQSGLASKFQANYLEANLKSRGLLNSTFGPELKSFPFLEDASLVTDAIRAFMKSFVSSYYPTSDDVTADTELQAWIQEAGPAEIKDFPTTVTDVDGIVDIMTHMCYLVAVQHGVLNSNTPVASTASLPLHPLAFYAPLPTEKGVADVMQYMPPLAAAVGQITLLAAFNRPQFLDTNQTLSHMFDDADIMARMNPETNNAAATFRAQMDAFSKVVRSRSFDAEGLSQGMPFIWNALDPNRAPYWVTI